MPNFSGAPFVKLSDAVWKLCTSLTSKIYNGPRTRPYLTLSLTKKMIQITPTLALDDSDIQFRFKRASGPGGQNVNKVSTAVELRLNLWTCTRLPWEVKRRLQTLAANRINGEGVLVIDAQRFRTQMQNRKDALARLSALISAAATPPTKRIATRPSYAARRTRLEEKRQQSQIKQTRRNRSHED